MCGTDADQSRLAVPAVGQLYCGTRGILNHVVIGNRMAGVAPNKTGASSLGHGKDVTRLHIVHQGGGGNEHYLTVGFFEQFDSVFSSTARSPRAVTERS